MTDWLAFFRLFTASNGPQVSHTFSKASRYCSYDMSLVSPPRLRDRLRERLRRRRLLRLTGLSLLLLHKGQHLSVLSLGQRQQYIVEERHHYVSTVHC